ncbi:hypothetical protein FHR83_005306 [Actinoplanes campanulatus]|uniref:Uncharacterized protein n=1 Tax=Actinoplanes campanulatus TaxID=113559 RepID=A0A7W5FGH4_9ACTN|nr:hypothetical protein [Actinoplanes campanulatus]
MERLAATARETYDAVVCATVSIPAARRELAVSR